MITHQLHTQSIIDSSTDEQLAELVESSPETAVEVMRQFSDVFEEYKSFHEHVVKVEAEIRKRDKERTEKLKKAEEEIKAEMERGNQMLREREVIIRAMQIKIDHYEAREECVRRFWGSN